VSSIFRVHHALCFQHSTLCSLAAPTPLHPPPLFTRFHVSCLILSCFRLCPSVLFHVPGSAPAYYFMFQALPQRILPCFRLCPSVFFHVSDFVRSYYFVSQALPHRIISCFRVCPCVLFHVSGSAPAYSSIFQALPQRIISCCRLCPSVFFHAFVFQALSQRIFNISCFRLCPSVFFYLTTIVPCVWILEINQLNERIKALPWNSTIFEQNRTNLMVEGVHHDIGNLSERIKVCGEIIMC